MRTFPGVDEERGFVDERVLRFLLADAVRVEFQGFPVGTPDVTEFKYHGVRELSVLGA